jgi:hypothetical protein
MLAQTKNGSVVWADAVFLRDLAELKYENIYGFACTPERVLKLACFMEIFGLQDCSAELITKRADMLSFDRDDLLDKLVPAYLDLAFLIGNISSALRPIQRHCFPRGKNYRIALIRDRL